MGKVYKYDGEEFEVSEPKDCKIRIEGKGQVGEIRVDTVNREFRVFTPGWNAHASDMEAAVDVCCARLIEMSKFPSEKERCKEMSVFYDGLNKK